MTMASMSVLSRSDKEKVHGAALRILSETGVRVESAEVLNILAHAGAKVDTGSQRAWLEEHMVAEALRTAPRKVRICSRGVRDHTVPEDGVQLISTDGQPPTVSDRGQGDRKSG